MIGQGDRSAVEGDHERIGAARARGVAPDPGTIQAREGTAQVCETVTGLALPAKAFEQERGVEVAVRGARNIAKACEEGAGTPERVECLVGASQFLQRVGYTVVTRGKAYGEGEVMLHEVRTRLSIVRERPLVVAAALQRMTEGKVALSGAHGVAPQHEEVGGAGEPAKRLHASIGVEGDP